MFDGNFRHLYLTGRAAGGGEKVSELDGGMAVYPAKSPDDKEPNDEEVQRG